ncbi:hypothetical protein Pcinc_026533 [Petrolisthes cinctipes]|uniref:Uncharacterized protein n=1 Tax=Petrolisthes cinctipes TaxID=88211 RepID=A0AAE1KA68_PETCI|nr:hypothetical protein Pcinc_026533 [Petrolisthes cinctipes]
MVDTKHFGVVHVAARPWWWWRDRRRPVGQGAKTVLQKEREKKKEARMKGTLRSSESSYRPGSVAARGRCGRTTIRG